MDKGLKNGSKKTKRNIGGLTSLNGTHGDCVVFFLPQKEVMKHSSPACVRVLMRCAESG